MAYSLDEARELVVRAGKMLVAEGLTARTWGNISARVSDTQMVITPSGLDYSGLRPEHIVAVDIRDCSYEGSLKPSSEKGIHADVYRLRADVDFVIHTHQKLASALSVTGQPLVVADASERAVLGAVVPCAEYGMPSTKALRRRVAAKLEKNPAAQAFLLKNHGALCLGADLESAFRAARALEGAAQREYSKAVLPQTPKPQAVEDLGRSRREGSGFHMELGGSSVFYFINALPTSAPGAAKLHAEIYKVTKAGCILHCSEAEAVTISQSGQVLKPYLDDLAQIAGVNIKCADFLSERPRLIGRALGRRSAVLIKGMGALCIGSDEYDAMSVATVLTKACAAAIYAGKAKKRCYLGSMDAKLQRLVYLLKYSKQQDKAAT